MKGLFQNVPASYMNDKEMQQVPDPGQVSGPEKIAVMTLLEQWMDQNRYCRSDRGMYQLIFPELDNDTVVV